MWHDEERENPYMDHWELIHAHPEEGWPSDEDMEPYPDTEIVGSIRLLA